MEIVTTLPAAIVTLILQKALEKVGDTLGEQAFQQSSKLFARLRLLSPQLSVVIDSILEQPLDYHRVAVELELLIPQDSECDRVARELVAVVSEKSDRSLEEPIRTFFDNLKRQNVSTINVSLLAAKVDVEIQRNSLPQDFDQAASYVLAKNAELYRRLA
jgi:hypothetical protein